MIVKALPNVFTASNLFFGMMSIILSFHHRVELAALMVLIALLTDGLDGKVARALNAQSEFGKELDSLSDMISFGVAPACLMYVTSFQHIGTLGWIVTAIFPIFGALRLARFNVTPAPSGYFIGLPIPAAGVMLSMFALVQTEVSFLLNMLLTIGLSFMMVSKFRYPNFKNASISNRIIWSVSALFIVSAIIFHLTGHGGYAKFSLLPLALYAIYGLIHRLNDWRCLK